MSDNNGAAEMTNETNLSAYLQQWVMFYSAGAVSEKHASDRQALLDTAASFKACADEIDRLRARVAELEPNDRRYRWMRERWGRIQTNFEHRINDAPTLVVDFRCHGLAAEDTQHSLDAAIDAALAKDGA